MKKHLGIGRKSGNLYYRMEVYNDGADLFSHHMTICMAVNKSKRAVNDFVRKTKPSRLTNRQNRKELAEVSLITSMLDEAISRISKFGYENVLVNITGSDVRRSRVYKYILDKKGYHTYISAEGELYLVLL